MRRWAVVAALAAFGPAWAAGGNFQSLLKAAKENPASADWTALRTAWAASPAYDPSVGGTPLQAGIDAAMDRRNFALAAQLAEQALRAHWLDLPAHLQAASAYQQLGQTSRATQHRAAARGLSQAIAATGNGRSAETAMAVLAAGEENAVAQDAQTRALSRQRVQTNGHWYDVLTVRHLPDRKLADIYFRVDEIVAREVALASGTKAVADGDAP